MLKTTLEVCILLTFSEVSCRGLKWAISLDWSTISQNEGSLKWRISLEWAILPHSSIETGSQFKRAELCRMLKTTWLAYPEVPVHVGDMIEVYKILHDIYDPEVGSFLDWLHQTVGDEESQTEETTHIGHATRGHRLKLKKHHVNLNIGLHSFRHRIVSLWNALQAEVVTAPSLNSFKTRIDKLFKNHPLLYNWEEAETSATWW